MYGTEITLAGKTLRKSRNLRAMRDYARVSPVVKVRTEKDPTNTYRGLLSVEYANGAHSRASFASFHVMVDWVRNRRSWKGAAVDHVSGDFGYLTSPGMLA